MPVKNFVDPAHSIVFTVCSGNVTRDELVSSFANLNQNPNFRPDFHQLIDLSQASQLELGFKSLFDIHRTCDPFSRKGKRAFIAPHADAFGTARIYQSIVNGPQIEVFRTTMEAIRWLGLEITILEGALDPERARKNTLRISESKSKGSTA